MKNTNESGRSMVEMLGVLAIIGVLSIGGIAGYTLAMNRYRANEILNAAALVSIAATSANGGVGDDADLSALGGINTMTLPAIKLNGDISSTAAGVVNIKVDHNYPKVAELVDTLSGARVTANKLGCDSDANCYVTVNMAASVKNHSTPSTDPTPGSTSNP